MLLNCFLGSSVLFIGIMLEIFLVIELYYSVKECIEVFLNNDEKIESFELNE